VIESEGVAAFNLEPDPVLGAKSRAPEAYFHFSLPGMLLSAINSALLSAFPTGWTLGHNDSSANHVANDRSPEEPQLASRAANAAGRTYFASTYP
jgi:hypothetical protein